MKPIPLLCLLIATAWLRAEEPVAWREWRPDLFAQATVEKKLVILDLGAVWCHWCHVMEETTYRDPAVNALLKAHFVTVRVDQDARPDLANRYEEYGWPATVIFDSKGNELVKRRGYIPPERMAALLQAVVDDPTPGPSVRAEEPVVPAPGGVTAELATALRQDFFDGYDQVNAGWGSGHKYLDADSIEYALVLGRAGDASAEAMARGTLDAARAILDPVWGGCYQYSTGGVWTEPHFEKIMPFQADALRAYALGFATWHRDQDRDAALGIVRYVRTFLTAPDGGFYTSQDADLKQGEHAGDYFLLGDAQRRALGIPRVDSHRYARDNGLMIASLCAWHAASGDREALDMAVQAARWILANRSDGAGGFRHDEVDSAGPYLGDTLAMGRAMLALHQVTGDAQWLAGAVAAAQVIPRRFASFDGAGFVTSASASALAPRPQRDENLAVARFANLLAAVSGDERFMAMAKQAERFLAAPAIAQRRPVAGLLLVAREGSAPPLHIQIVGARDDAAAVALHAAALAIPDSYRHVEWIAAGAKAPHALVCGAASCSKPLRSVEELQAYLARR